MENLSAHKFPEVYAELGIDLRKLGCIMIDVDASNVYEPIDEIISDSIAYTSPDPEKFWIKGKVIKDTPHATLLYGLLEDGLIMKPHVDRVLEGAIPDSVKIESVGYFPSPYPDEKYWCIVAHLEKTPKLLEANERLKFLPHVNVFPGYKAHLTLAYIQGTEAERDNIVNDLDVRIFSKELRVTGLNYGDKK